MGARDGDGGHFRELPLAGLETAALLRAGSEETVGAWYRELTDFARGADLLLNISGMLRDERLLASIPVRAWVLDESADSTF